MSEKVESKLFRLALKNACANLENNKQMVNNLNVFPVPDGDTGTNMALTMQFAVKEMLSSDAQNVGELARVCSNGALMGARGNSGVILSQLLRGFAKAVKGRETISNEDIALAFDGAAKMAYRAVMKPTEGTILTVAREMAEFAMDNHSKYSDTPSFLDSILKSGEISLSKTPDLLPVLKEAGVVDAGGRGLLCLIEGALKAAKGEELDNAMEVAPIAMEEKTNIDGDIEFAYCTEFLIRTNDKKDYKNLLKTKLAPKGDCLLVVGDEDLIKVHIHTNEPWNAMKIAATCGDLSKIKIENMREQHSEAFPGLEEAKEEKYDNREVDYVFIGVAAGNGLSQILKDLGITYVIEGGQTMNPSTSDFLEIINNTKGKNYILFPNNKNIILAATQTKELSEKNIEVIPTKNIPQAISAMMVFDPSSTLKDNALEMSEAIGDVMVGQVTFAVRDSVSKGKEIKEGEYLGIIGSDIIANTNKLDKTIEKLVKGMITMDSELLTLYYGEDVSEEDANKMAQLIEKKFPDLEVEIHYGGQPLYYYILSVE